MTTPVFPQLPGQGWSVKITPTFSTRVASHVSGREARSSLYAKPLYQFEVTYDGLDSKGLYPGLGRQSLQALMQLWLQCRGQYGAFLYTDPDDNTVGNQILGYGDGVTTDFTATRVFAGVTEEVSYITSLASVYVNTTVASGVSLVSPNVVRFVTAPYSGAVISASYRYAHLCRFLDDQTEFDNFMNGLWQVKSLKFRSVR